MDTETNVVELATDLTVAWLANPNTRMSTEEVPAFLRSMHDAVSKLAAPPPSADAEGEVTPDHVPAVSVRKSLASPDHILSMIDGKAYKTLRRHLSTNGLTPDEYRQRYKLKADYPMVAATYSEARRTMAKAIGLGRKAGQKIAKPEPIAKAARKPRKAAPATSE